MEESVELRCTGVRQAKGVVWEKHYQRGREAGSDYPGKLEDCSV
jgi:hypothetical protein